MRTYYSYDVADLVRDQLRVHFTGHSFSVRCDGGWINIDWEDGPAPYLVERALDQFRFSLGLRAFVFPDGSMLEYTSEFDIPPGEGELVAIKASGFKVERELSEALIKKIAKDFLDDTGISVELEEPRRWAIESRIFYPKSFIVYTGATQGRHVRWSSDRDSSRIYEHTIRPVWENFVLEYSDYDSSKSAATFLISTKDFVMRNR